MSKRHHLSEAEEDECPNEKRSKASDTDEVVPCVRNESSKSYFVLWVKGTLKIINLTEELEKGKNNYTKLEEVLKQCMAKAEEEQARADEATNRAVVSEFQLSEALLLFKGKEEGNVQLQKQFKKEIDEIKAELKNERNVSNEVKSRMKELEEENQTLINSVKRKDYQIHDFQNRYEEKERMLKLSENELAQANSKNESLERFLNELIEIKNRQEKEIAGFQTKIDEVMQKLADQTAEMEHVMWEANNQKAEKESSQYKIESKEEIAADLQIQLTDMQRLCDKKIQEFQKLEKAKESEILNLRKQLEELTKKLINERAEIKSNENKQAQLQKLMESKNQEVIHFQSQLNEMQKHYTESIEELQKAKRTIAKLHSGILTSKERCSLQHNNATRLNQEKAALAKENDSNKTEIEKLKMQLQNFDKNREKDRAQMEKHITEEAEKMFHKWKKDHEKENDEKDRRIQKLEKQLYDEKKLCQEMFKNQRSATFLNQFAGKLFARVEKILQPLEQLPKEAEEISKIIHYFYKDENPEVKRMYFKELKATLNARRCNARNAEYKECNKYRSIGITSDGKKFYYSLRPQNASNQKWHPFSDKNCQTFLPFKMPKLSSFGIPLKYASCEYILIISSNTDNGDGGEIHKMYPKRGFIERISKPQKTSKAV